MRNRLIFYPFLFAIYPIVFLYSFNVQEILFNQLYEPIAISLLGTLILYLIVSLFIKDKHKSALIVTTLLLIFFLYGHIHAALITLGSLSLKHRHFLPGILLLGGYISYFIYSSKQGLLVEKISKIFKVVIISLLIFNILNIVPNEIKKLNLAGSNNVKAIKNEFDNTSDFPDIYYIVFDEYASLSTIKEIWNYDNSEFANSLKDKGFFIAEESKSRFNTTGLSFASSLNMNFVDPETSTLDIYTLINNNEVFKYLKGKGYKIAVFDNWYSINPPKGEMQADYHFNYVVDSRVQFIDEFSMLLINSTILKPFSYFLELSYTNIDDVHRNATLFALEKLKHMPDIDGPKFVYAHIFIPHTPFIFDQNGLPVESVNKYNWKDRKYYLDQYIYASKQALSIASSLLEKSTKPPIIIIQSDHGPRPHFGQIVDQRLEIPKENGYKIFNAYYLPNFESDILANNISPVNSFRLIFNYYFGEKFEMLED